ncbi:MAG: glycosyltransferase family 2 protein [Planctomycetes bacterium]|nr:glycosyltransferase family 2 protein [Planctomycetota bacterium]
MTVSQPTARPDVSDVTLSVVLPVYNEAAVLPLLVTTIVDAVEPCVGGFELIFVNDGSSDESGLLLDGLASRYPFLRVVHVSRNFGHQAAVQAGLAHAAGDVVVLMDSDMQDSPAAIRRMLDEWQQGYDVVYAIRTDRKENIVKRTLFAAFHRFLSSIADTKIPADAGNFSLMDARVAREIVRLGERDRYLPGLRAWVGFRQKGIEVERESRYDDRPRVSLRGLMRLAKTAIFSFSGAPLSVFSMIGWTAAAVFLGLGGYSLYCKTFTTLAIPGWTSHILSASFFGALNALGISMLGEYVVRIYDQVRARPVFLVDRLVNFADVSEDDDDVHDSLLQEAESLLDSTLGAMGSLPALAESSDLTVQAPEVLKFTRNDP